MGKHTDSYKIKLVSDETLCLGVKAGAGSNRNYVGLMPCEHGYEVDNTWNIGTYTPDTPTGYQIYGAKSNGKKKGWCITTPRKDDPFFASKSDNIHLYTSEDAVKKKTCPHFTYDATNQTLISGDQHSKPNTVGQCLKATNDGTRDYTWQKCDNNSAKFIFALKK